MKTSKKLLGTITILCLSFSSQSFSQDEPDLNKMLAELSVEGCKCMEKIKSEDRKKSEVLESIKTCIENETDAYHLGKQIMAATMEEVKSKIEESPEKTEGKSEENSEEKKTITVNLDKGSEEYQKSYREVESYLMDNCPELKSLVASNDEENRNSVSNNPKALAFYNKGIKQMEAEKYIKAIEYFEQAVEIDPKFAFAYDNIGLAYRKLEEYDLAIENYNKSLEIDPKGTFPLQNLAVAYQYKKEYAKAIEAYQKLAELDENNPEIYYGIGVIYSAFLNDNETGLQNLCKAYNLYTEQKSPYRTDAEKLINVIYANMKKEGKEDRFMEILKENNIATE